MKRFLTTLIIVCLAFTSTYTAQGQQLTKVTVQFRTNDENKDHDTKVTYSLVRNDSAVAQLRDFAGNTDKKAQFPDKAEEFKDKTSSSRYNIPIFAGGATKGQLQKAKSQIIITPSGKDTWRFNLHVKLEYSDGTSEEKVFSRIELSENGNKRRGEWSH